MAKVFKFDANTLVTLKADNVDDGAGIFVDNVKVTHVDFGKSGSHVVKVTPQKGVQVRFELWNQTGGAFHGLFRISGKVNGRNTEVYYYAPMGQSPPMTAVAWQEAFILQVL